MERKDKEYLISAGILIFVGWFVAGIICGGVAWSLCNKVKEDSPIRTVLKVLAIVETLFCVYWYILKD